LVSDGRLALLVLHGLQVLTALAIVAVSLSQAGALLSPA
jgi:hypothetical protein